MLGVLFWFVLGWVTVVIAGGISRRPKLRRPAGRAGPMNLRLVACSTGRRASSRPLRSRKVSRLATTGIANGLKARKRRGAALVRQTAAAEYRLICGWLRPQPDEPLLTVLSLHWDAGWWCSHALSQTRLAVCRNRRDMYPECTCAAGSTRVWHQFVAESLLDAALSATRHG